MTRRVGTGHFEPTESCGGDADDLERRSVQGAFYTLVNDRRRAGARPKEVWVGSFVNEIVWKRSDAKSDVGQGAKHFPRIFVESQRTKAIGVCVTA